MLFENRIHLDTDTFEESDSDYDRSSSSIARSTPYPKDEKDVLKNIDYSGRSFQDVELNQQTAYNFDDESKVPLSATSHEDMEQLQEKEGMNRFKVPFFSKLTGGFTIILVFLLAVLSTDFGVSSSCQKDSLACVPQMTIKPTDDTLKAKLTLSTLREGLKMVSYLATDLGVSNDDLQSNVDYMNTIDTFSTNKLYKFNSNGFCRYNSDTKEQYCSNGHGLDIFSSLAADIGIQLGKVGGGSANDSQEMRDSMVSTYTNIVDLLDALYYTAINNETESNSLKMEQLNAAHHLKSIRSFGELMSKIPNYTISFSIIAVILLVSLFFMERRRSIKGTKANNKIVSNVLYGGMFTILIVHLGIILGRNILQLRTFHSIDLFFKAYEIAKVEYGWGQIFLWLMVLCDLAAIFALFTIFRRR